MREKSLREPEGDEESISTEDSDIDEELGYISPLDTVDPYVTFKQALTSTYISSLSYHLLVPILTYEYAGFQMKDGNGYQAATTSLSPEQQMLLMEVMRVAEERSQTLQV